MEKLTKAQRKRALRDELNARLAAALGDYASEHGLTRDGVLDVARSLLLPPQKANPNE